MKEEQQAEDDSIEQVAKNNYANATAPVRITSEEVELLEGEGSRKATNSGVENSLKERRENLG